MRWGLVVAFVALLAAGCSDPASKASDEPATESASVAGVVVDVAVRPIEGAAVTIPAVPGVAATTAADGTFRIGGLAPGAVVLQVEKDGYLLAVAQTQAVVGDAPLVKVVLEDSLETKPYLVQEAFEGLMTCGLGSAAVFGMTAPCEQLAGAGVATLCRGQDPVPPTGVCLAGTNPYYATQAGGNMTMSQTELTWDPTLNGAELMVIQWAVGPDGQLIRGIASATGPPFVVSRLGPDVLREYEIGAANTLSLYVSVGNAPAANVVLQQPFRMVHTTAYHFTFDEGWTFIEDGLPTLPPSCTVC